MRIPDTFLIMRQTDDLIELRSKYHYWRMTLIPGADLYLLAHKYHIKDTYHKQALRCGNPTTLKNIFSYIREHDEYIDSQNNGTCHI